MSEKNKGIIKQVNAAIVEGNIEEFLSYCAEEVQWTMVGDRTVKGKESIRRWMADMASETPERPRVTVSNLIAEGDIVADEGTMTMKDKEGKTVTYSFSDIYRFRGDQIAELNSYVIKTGAKHKTSSGT